MNTISIPLQSLQVATMTDEFGIMALRSEFGDSIVEVILDELPHLESSLAIAARHADMDPAAFVASLRRSVDVAMSDDAPSMAIDSYEHKVAETLIDLIDPTHNMEDRRSLKELLSYKHSQILEDSGLVFA